MTADRSAELVPFQGRRSVRLGEGIAPKIREVLRVIPEVLESREVDLIAARLGGSIQDSGTHVAEFRIVILCRNLLLRQRIDVGIDDDDAQYGILIFRSIQLIAGAAEMLAIHLDLGAALRIFTRCVSKADLGGAWREQFQGLRVAAQAWQVHQLLGSERSLHVGPVRLQRGSGSGHLYGLGYVARL